MSDSPPNPYPSPETSQPARQLNPYETPREVRSPGSIPLLPPLATPLLVIGLVLITIAWLTLWADLNGMIVYGILIIAMCGGLLARVIKPHSIPWKGVVPSRAWVRILFAFGGLLAFLNLGTILPPEAKGTLSQPVIFIIGWGISCGFLLRHWWKRRKNPPY